MSCESHPLDRKVYILLTRFPGKVSMLLAVLTGCYYVHASIGLEDDLNTFYSFVTKGFIIEQIARYVRPDRVPYPCQLYELPVSENVYQSIKYLLNTFVDAKDRLRYTKLGVFFGLLGIPYRRKEFCYFCTHFVAHILQNSGAAILQKNCTHYFSRDLKKLPGMKLCYQGNLQTMLIHFQLPQGVWDVSEHSCQETVSFHD